MTSDPLSGDPAPGRPVSLDRRSVLAIGASAGAAAVVSGAGFGVAAAPAVAGEVAAPIPALAQVAVPAGVLSVPQRQAMVAGITRVLADVSGAGPAGLPYLTVIVADAVEGGWGVAGHGYIRSELAELVSGRPLPPGAAPAGAR